MISVELASFGSVEDFLRALMILRAVQHGERAPRYERVIKRLVRLKLIEREKNCQPLPVLDKLNLRIECCNAISTSYSKPRS